MAQWFLSYDGKQIGPMSHDDALRRVRENSEGYAWREGFSDWMAISDVVDFKEAERRSSGLFGSLGGGRETPLSPRAGLLLAAISMVAADGSIDDDEVNVIRRLDGTDKTEAWEAATQTWKAKKVSECMELAARAMDSEQQLIAMANLIDIAMADGILAGAEQAMLERYMELFNISEDDVKKIVDVISIKNNKEPFNRS